MIAGDWTKAFVRSRYVVSGDLLVIVRDAENQSDADKLTSKSLALVRAQHAKDDGSQGAANRFGGEIHPD
jgi:hypothetical protein